MTGSRKAAVIIVLILLVLIMFPVIWRSALKRQYRSNIFDPKSAPQKEAAVVFGAAVFHNGRLSTVLRDRMNTAVQLYKNGKVERILVSGDRRNDGYDEPGSMMAYAINSGINPEHIIPDYGGKRTYDTCYRARENFDIGSAILVTQEFHLPRALFTCNRLGLPAVGVSADQRIYRAASWYEFRETAASTIALLDIVRGQKPVIIGAAAPIR